VSARPHARPAGETVLFFGLLALHVLPIWVFPFIPTQDGPSHQALTFILRQYDHPDAGLLRQYYLPNQEALPNLFIFFLMGRVLAFVSVPVAEKILLTAYVLLLPLSVRYALRAVKPRAVFLALLAFPFVYNFFFQMGFFNFCFSLAAFFFAVGFWLKHADEMGPGRTAILALLLLWVYFCHPVTLVVTVVTLLTTAGWRTLLAPALWQGARRWLLAPSLACLPALILMASFVGSRADRQISMMPMWTKVRNLASLHSLASLTLWTVPLAIAVAVLFYALAVLCLKARRGRPLEAADGLLLAVAVLTVAFFASPDRFSAGGIINDRLLLFPFLVSILWFGTFDHTARRRLAVQIAAAGMALAFLGLFAWKYGELNRSLAEIAAAGDHVEPDHTLLFLSYAHQGEDGRSKLAFRTWPFVHAGGYIGARKRLVDLSLYEASSDFFPLYFRPALDPYRHLAIEKGSMEMDPPRADLLGYPKRTGGRVDYVLLWGLRDERRNEPKARALLDQLAAGYDLIYSSRDGRVGLYRLRDSHNRSG